MPEYTLQNYWDDLDSWWDNFLALVRADGPTLTERKSLEARAKTHPAYQRLYDQFRLWALGGQDAHGKPNHPKPIRPTE